MTQNYAPEGTLINSPENRKLLASPAGLEKAMLDGTILEEYALMCDSDMTLHLDLCGVAGILPREEAAYCRPGEQLKDVAVITRVGKPVCFKIAALTRENGKLTARLSRRAAQRDCAREYLSDLIPGDIVKARVTHHESFGAFADIGCGISSLIPVDCLSVSRISHPRDRLACGACIYAVVRSVDHESGRIFLTQKELLGTWQENAARFSVGQTVAGIVRSIESYGVFLELAPNLAGLAEPRGCAVDGDLRPGDTAAVYIKSMLPERMKVKLVLIDSHASPQPAAPIKYYIDCERTTHIDRWIYSPPGAQKTIETLFS